MGETQFPKDFTPQCPHLAWLAEYLSGWQFGEQGLIHAIVRQLQLGSEYFLEYGAGDGSELPLTLAKYAKEIPDRVILVEVDGARRLAVGQEYPLCPTAKTWSWDTSYRVPPKYDVVVIDIDGRDSIVMQEMFDADVRPTMLVVEHMDRHYPITTSAPAVIPSWLLGRTLKTGHAIQDTAETLHAIAAAHGYERIGYNRCNSFFVVKERYNELFR